MTVLITGAAGFIGSHVCEYFIKNGFDVIGVDNFDPYYSRRIKEKNLACSLDSPQFSFYEGDILNRSFLDPLFENNSIDGVVHLAAKAGVRESIKNINGYFESNLLGTLALLEAMRNAGVSNMIFASSSSVYGLNNKPPYAESDNTDFPVSPYACTKKNGETLCNVYARLYDFNITCLRFFTVYGPRQRPDLAIYKFIHCIEEDRSVPFYGDGFSARDYTYIDDIVQGIHRAYERLNGFRVYNLGGAKTVSLQKLLLLIEKILGKKAILELLASQPGDMDITSADISKARVEIGYNPEVNLEDGIQRFVEWYYSTVKKLKL
jgi:UDP-glucuronate 4-epimerase